MLEGAGVRERKCQGSGKSRDRWHRSGGAERFLGGSERGLAATLGVGCKPRSTTGTISQ